MIKQRSGFTWAAVIAAAALLLCCLFTCACAQEEEFPTWKISASVTANFEDNGKHGFILNVQGTGDMPDYSSKKDAPWYGKSGRVTDIVIAEGVTAVGDNAFADCAAKTVVLPESVKKVGSGAFSAKTSICAYGSVTVEDGAKVYLYSESKPQSAGDYWRFKGGVATVWEKLRVLFIGNSFTYYSNVPALFGQIANAAGESVEVERITHGSYTLAKYADPNDVTAETDEDNKGCGKLVDETLKARSDYDVVVLQEQSTRPRDNYNSFTSAVGALKDKILATQDNCKIYLYATWGYDERKDGVTDEARKQTITKMESDLTAAYEKAAAEHGLEVCRVGSAFTAVYTQHPEINVYHADRKHPSYEGAFLSACVHAAQILNCDPRVSTFNGELSAATATVLKEAAYRTVFGS